MLDIASPETRGLQSLVCSECNPGGAKGLFSTAANGHVQRVQPGWYQGLFSTAANGHVAVGATRVVPRDCSVCNPGGTKGLFSTAVNGHVQ